MLVLRIPPLYYSLVNNGRREATVGELCAKLSPLEASSSGLGWVLILHIASSRPGDGALTRQSDCEMYWIVVSSKPRRPARLPAYRSIHEDWRVLPPSLSNTAASYTLLSLIDLSLPVAWFIWSVPGYNLPMLFIPGMRGVVFHCQTQGWPGLKSQTNGDEMYKAWNHVKFIWVTHTHKRQTRMK
jgi:hypothetical protein